MVLSINQHDHAHNICIHDIVYTATVYYRYCNLHTHGKLYKTLFKLL